MNVWKYVQDPPDTAAGQALMKMVVEDKLNDQQKLVAGLYICSNCSFKRITEFCGVSYTRVRRIYAKTGLPVRSRGGSHFQRD